MPERGRKKTAAVRQPFPFIINPHNTIPPP